MNDGDASPIDSNYPGRYYVDPPCRGENGEVDQDFYKENLRDVAGTTPYRMFMRFVLPEGLTCKHCVVQCKYCEWFGWLQWCGFDLGCDLWFFTGSPPMLKTVWTRHRADLFSVYDRFCQHYTPSRATYHNTTLNCD